MRISDIHSGFRADVAYHSGESLDIHAIFKCHRGEGVAQLGTFPSAAGGGWIEEKGEAQRGDWQASQRTQSEPQLQQETRDVWEHAGGFRFLIFQMFENPIFACENV